MKTYRFIILSPEKKLYDGMVTSLSAPGDNGRLTVLADHAPMVAALARGNMVIRLANENEALEGSLDSGLLKVGNHEVVALVHGFAWVEDKGEAEAEDLKNADGNPLLL